MGFHRLGILVLMVITRVQSTCQDESWMLNTFPRPQETVNVSHITEEKIDLSYILLILLSWDRPNSPLDFDGYVINVFPIGEKRELDITCELKEDALYTNQTKIDIPVKYNYEYKIQFKLASKKNNTVSALTDGSLFFNGIDCYQDTENRDFCMTQEPQYISAPLDVRVENITTSSGSHEVWVSMYPPVVNNRIASLDMYTFTIRALNLSFDDEETFGTINEANMSRTERQYFKYNRNFAIETLYNMTLIAYASTNEVVLKPSLESSIYFNYSDYLRERKTDTNSKNDIEPVTQPLSIYYTLVMPVLIGAILFATVVILIGFYTRRQRRKDIIPQFKRQPDDSFIKSKHDYFEYREIDPLFAKKEFDRDMLKIEEELGSGQFGVVCKGFACGIDGGNDYIPVAVKSLKGHASRSMKDYFLDEIRLIIDIGNHPNILGILGCCTVDEPYYLITEFMHYGDLFHFLLKCREAKYALEDPIFHLVYEHQVQIARQIARGMDYLSSTRYYHGDLAARNILVDKGLTIKISDFGLADDIYQSDYKHLAPDRKRPVKWVSLETNLQGICTIQSDIWSFGIVLYEISTLGGMPYPGMQSIEVVERLKDGYRMEQPEKCSDEWYQMMLECWEANPSKRPKFSELFSRLDAMLVENAVDYLLPLDGDIIAVSVSEDDLALGTSAKSYTPISSEDITNCYEGSENDVTEGIVGKIVSMDDMSKPVAADSAFYDDIGYT